MKQSRHRIASVVILLSIVMVVWWLWPKSQMPHSNAHKEASPLIKSLPSQIPAQRLTTKQEWERVEQEKREKVVAQVEAMLTAPISFSGRVVDQNGAPVPNARIGYSLLDKFNASGSNSHKTAGPDGIFEITGVNGAVLGVNVSREGYYQIHNVSNQRFAYGTGQDAYTKRPPTKDNPAVFVLHKMGNAETLVVVESRTFLVPKNGSPVTYDLKTGHLSKDGQIRVEAWTGDNIRDQAGRYEWKCRVSVPGGGLVERTGEFDFDAPSEGYKEDDEIIVTKNDPQWKSQAERQYFIHTAEDHYARIKFKMIAGGDHFFRIESHLNPTPSSRNLEYDAAKQVSKP